MSLVPLQQTVRSVIDLNGHMSLMASDTAGWIGSRSKKVREKYNANKYTKQDWLKAEYNDLDRNVQKLQLEIALLKETISHQNIDLTNILKAKKGHLKQIIKKYEELDPGKPSIKPSQNPSQLNLLTLSMESPVSRWKLPENDFRHCDILKAIEQIVPKAFEKKQVSKIQFENMNVIYGTAGSKNRWLITVSDFQTRNLLLDSGLEIDGEHFSLHRHDNVIVKDGMVDLRKALTKKEFLETLIDSTDLTFHGHPLLSGGIII
ncbi:LOW QUALITY PROTEIN: uncharacterized protein C19orf81 homolog [Leptodactylus fuscus]